MSNHYLIDGEKKEAKGIASIDWIDDVFFTINFLGKKYHGEIVDDSIEDRIIAVKVNHRYFEIRKEHPLDDLIKALGLDKKKVKKLHQLQSPMPGRVLSFAVEQGAHVAIGSPLLTLEAMKMENVIKAEGEGIVKSIVVEGGSVVEKGQLLIEFE
ncbi:MAG: acetyl-CoA carboxylase biotin carboxyl carrier protein subunit [Crocinitomicaceae bacterium]|nr:acetyl-CoA carboxylase biotin carboxyl carrier protein subunit [Crocinitomicaceae bacterium]